MIFFANLDKKEPYMLYLRSLDVKIIKLSSLTIRKAKN